MIADGKLDSEIRVQAGLDHLLQNHSGASAGSVDTKSLEEACGVGIVVTPEMIEQEVLRNTKYPFRLVTEEFEKLKIPEIFFQI